MQKTDPILNTTELLQKIQTGNKVSFETVYLYFYPKLIYFAKQYLLDLETSKNVVQDVFTELWDRRNMLFPETNLNSWLYTVTKNKSLKIIDQLKSKTNYNNFFHYRQLIANYKSLDEFDTSSFTFEELQNQLQKTLEKLSPGCREIFEMSRFEDKKNREIAEELNISIKTVEAQISKALKTLRISLKEYLPIAFLLSLFQ